MNTIDIDGHNSFNDFGAVLNPYTIPAPEPKTNIVDIPGADGELDLSTALTGGRQLYNNRQFDLTFSFLPTIQDDSKFVNFVHGKKHKFIFADDPEFYWIGKWAWGGTEKARGGIRNASFTINAEPYKYDVELTHFTKPVKHGVCLHLENSAQWVKPTIISDQPITLIMRDEVFQIVRGRQINDNFVLHEGRNVIKCNGEAKLQFEYRQGRI